MATEYTETSSELARQAGVTAALIRLYAGLGLLDFETASNGTRLFRRGQAERVQTIYAERMAGRGRKRA